MCGHSRHTSSSQERRVRMSISRKTVSSPHLTSRPARGHLLIGQSGGATAVINASLAGAALAAMEAEAVDGVYGARYGIRGVLDDDLIDLRRLPMDTWDILRGTPSAALGSCRYKLRDDDAERAVAMLR